MSNKKKQKGRRSDVSFFISKGKQIKINPDRYFFYTTKGKLTTFGRWKALSKKGLLVTKKLKVTSAILSNRHLNDLLLFRDFYQYEVVVVVMGEQEVKITSKKILEAKLKSLRKDKTNVNVFHTKAKTFSKANVYFVMINSIGTPILHQFALYTKIHKTRKKDYWIKKYKSSITVDTALKITNFINQKSLEQFTFDSIAFLTLEN